MEKGYNLSLTGECQHHITLNVIVLEAGQMFYVANMHAYLHTDMHTCLSTHMQTLYTYIIDRNTERTYRHMNEHTYVNKDIHTYTDIQ